MQSDDEYPPPIPLPAWHLYEGGVTLGARGAEGGTIIRDEEHPYSARITLERDTLRLAPFAITCTLAAELVHTRFIADEPTALAAYDKMKVALEHILDLLDRQEYDDAYLYMDRFAERFA
jgi:hypothetical protein